MLFILIVGFGISNYFQQPGIIAVISFGVYVVHVLYLPIFLLSSLKIEGKTQLWLYNPNSGSMLFLAKIAAGLTYYFISILIALIITYWTVHRVGFFLEFQDQVLRGLLFLGVSTLFITIYLGIWVLFYWTFYHSMKNIPYVKNIRWLIIIAVWLALNTLGNFISNLTLYKKMSEIWAIQIHVVEGLHFETSQMSTTMTPNFGMIPFSFVTEILNTILMVGVFFISVWLLERKVEV